MSLPGPRVLLALGNAQLFGQERENVEVLRAARAAGVDALVATHADWGAHEVEPHLDRLGLAWARVPYAWHLRRQLPKKLWLANLARWRRGSRAFADLMRRYRPTHVQVANPHYFWAVLPALLRSRVPVVYRIGDEPTWHHAFYRWLWRTAIVPRTARFVCVSRFIQQQIVARGVPPERTCVVYPLPPARPVADPPDVAPFDGRTIVYLGEVAEHKGVHLLVEAAGRLAREGRRVRVLVAGLVKGDRARPFVRDLEARVAALPAGAEVQFLGYVQNISALLAHADVHAAPSVGAEAAGLIVLEAKQAGVPSVVFPSGGMVEFITRPGVDGIVCADRTAEALTDGLRTVLDLAPEVRAAAGEAARASLADLGGTPEAFAAAWRRIYDETARHPYAT